MHTKIALLHWCAKHAPGEIVHSAPPAADDGVFPALAALVAEMEGTLFAELDAVAPILAARGSAPAVFAAALPVVVLAAPVRQRRASLWLFVDYEAIAKIRVE